MNDTSKDAWLNERARHQRKGRTFQSSDELRWGELILPATGKIPKMFSPSKQAVMMRPIEGNTRFRLAEADPALFGDR